MDCLGARAEPILGNCVQQDVFHCDIHKKAYQHSVGTNVTRQRAACAIALAFAKPARSQLGPHVKSLPLNHTLGAKGSFYFWEAGTPTRLGLR
jgi:hypothetical protein